MSPISSFSASKIYWSIFLLVSLMALGLIIYFSPRQETEDVFRPADKGLSQFEKDQKIYNEAVSSVDRDGCKDVVDVDLGTTCERVVDDIVLYMQATSEKKPEICNQIKSAARKNACLSVLFDRAKTIGASTTPVKKE